MALVSPEELKAALGRTLAFFWVFLVHPGRMYGSIQGFFNTFCIAAIFSASFCKPKRWAT
ncbi:MAG: hypothetical protein EA392_14945 [Cryomorphaceae bacterium]|nr:MAG: hypothetical protein EA392_14945 [Cryomorphaceae bacterium]